MSRAYYNEIDPAAAAVLRALIARDVIAPGDVDTRSIKEVQPDDLKGYTQCHFFAGGGLWSVAARLAGWPDTKLLWSGSCPCQPFSVAGKGAGADDPRHLWPDFNRLISARRPAVVVGEQVAGKAGRDWFDGVRTDLEAGGYAARAVDVPACAVDAPHIRQRQFWVAADMAYAGGRASQRCGEPREFQGAASRTESQGREWERRGSPVTDNRERDVRVADAGCGVGGRRPDEPQRGSEGRTADRRAGEAGVALGDAYSAGQREHGGPEPVRSEQPSAECAGGLERDGSLADAACIPQRKQNDDMRAVAWQWSRTGAGGSGERHGIRGCNGSFWSDHEWRVGPDGKARRVKPGLRLLVDGLQGRVGLLRIGGNAIVPQVAAEVLAAFLDVEVAENPALADFDAVFGPPEAWR